MFNAVLSGCYTSFTKTWRTDSVSKPYIGSKQAIHYLKYDIITGSLPAECCRATYTLVYNFYSRYCVQAIAESPSVEYRDGFVRKREDWDQYLASEANFTQDDNDSRSQHS